MYSNNLKLRVINYLLDRERFISNNNSPKIVYSDTIGKEIIMR